jgi:cell fate regulator YaaT (PSP1 superfamily)
VTDGEDAPEGGDEPSGPAAEGEGGERRRRRRRRRRGDGGGDPQQAQGQGPAPPSPPQPQQQPQRERPPQQPQRERPPQQQQQRERPPQQQRERQPQQPRQERGRRDGDRNRGDRDRRDGRPAAADPRPAPEPRPAAELPAPRLEHRRGPEPTSSGDEPDDDTSGVAWGTDDPGPAASITLGADLPLDPPADDPDPTSADADALDAAPAKDTFADLVNLVGVRLASAGRIYWCDAHDLALVRGDRVIVEGEKGPRLATVAADARLQPTRDRDQKLRRVTRRATAADLRVETDAIAAGADLLRVAKQRVRELRIPAKVFRVERYGGHRGGRVIVYYTSDERIELRELVRELGTTTGARVELRQIGVRDEAKLVGGIGSCGLELCCTTWLPEFVPVSIKMAKDQGMVLSPTKVSGQCGRLKCCLVYEQATYAELRKGLPKLGKRVITARGEGRVVEVDVLRGRVRVGYGPGDSEVLPGGDVKPMFPSGGPGGGRASGSQDAIDPAEVLDAADDPSLNALADTDDPSAAPRGDDLD